MSFRMIPVLMLLLLSACGRGDRQANESSAPEDRSDSRVRMGLALVTEGHVDAAMEQFHRLAGQGGEAFGPGREPEWGAQLVQQLLRRRQLDLADSLLSLVGPLESRSAELRYLTANLRALQGLEEEALAAYRSVDGEAELMRRAHHEMATILLKSGRAEEALAEARLAVELQPDSSSLHLLLAEALRRLSRVDEALEECAAVAPGPDRWMMEGEIHLENLGHPEEAVKLFEQALQASPSIPNIRFQLGRALLAAGNPARALKAIEPLARRDPPFISSLEKLVEVYRALGRTASADSLKELLDREALRAEWNRLRAGGLDQEHRGNVEAALDSFERALDLAPEVADLHNDRGAALARLERWEEAEKEFLAAARLDPQNATFVQNLARLYHRTGDVEAQDRAVARWKALSAAADSAAKVDNR